MCLSTLCPESYSQLQLHNHEQNGRVTHVYGLNPSTYPDCRWQYGSQRCADSASNVNDCNYCQLQSCKTLMMQLHVDMRDSHFATKSSLEQSCLASPKSSQRGGIDFNREPKPFWCNKTAIYALNTWQRWEPDHPGTILFFVILTLNS